MNLGTFDLFIYGVQEERVEKIFSDLKKYLPKKRLLEKGQYDEDFFCEEIWSHVTGVSESHSIQRDIMFINADDMKKNPLKGSDIDEIYFEIRKKSSPPEKPFLILFNRYLDSPSQFHYLGEKNDISLFQSYNPGNSDAFYLSSGGTKLMNEKIDMKTKDFKKKLFDLVRDGKINCFSFNPNLYVFDLAGSEKIDNIQYIKSSIINCSSLFEKKGLGKSISLLLSNHVLLFWAFFVFFICTIFIIILKTFKIGSQLL